MSQIKVLIEHNHNQKLKSVGMYLTMDMTWKGLIRLSLLVRDDQNINLQKQRESATCDWASALWFQQHSESAFFVTPCRYVYCLSNKKHSKVINQSQGVEPKEQLSVASLLLMLVLTFKIKWLKRPTCLKDGLLWKSTSRLKCFQDLMWSLIISNTSAMCLSKFEGKWLSCNN